MPPKNVLLLAQSILEFNVRQAAGVELMEGMKYVEIVNGFNSTQSAPSCVKDCTSDATLLWRSEGVKLA